MMKKMCKKLIVCLMLILTLFNFMCSIGGNLGEIYATEDTTESDQVIAETEKEASGSINGIASFLEKALRAMAVMIGELIQSLAYFVAQSGGTTDSTASTSSAYYSVFDLFFDKFTITSVNVFRTDDLPTDSSGNVDETGIVYSFRSAISGLYALSTAVAGIFLLVFVAIAFVKKFFGGTPETKESGNNELTDCLFKFALVVFADLIVLFVLMLNQSVINLLYKFGEGLDVSNFMKNLRSAALGDSYILGWGCCIAFIIVCWQTFKYTIAYILRFFMVALLTVIAPFMGLFYSHSKSSQGIPGSFNKWFKLFVSNVFIQSIDCLLYLMCVAIPLASTINNMSSVENVSGLCGAVMLIAGVMFVKQGEKVLMKLLGLEDSVISMNSVSNGISNAVHKVTNTALTGVAIGQGNYSVMNVTNSPVSFGNNIQGATGNGSSPDGGILHQAKQKAQDAFKGNDDESSYSSSNSASSGRDAGQTTSDDSGQSSRGANATALAGIAAGVAAGVAGHVAEDENEKDRNDINKVQQTIDDLKKNLVADGLVDPFKEALKESENSNTSQTIEKDGTHTEETSEKDTFEKEETSTETIHMVPGENDGLDKSQDGKEAEEFADRLEEYRDKFDEIDDMYTENAEKHREELEAAAENVENDRALEIQTDIDDMLRQKDSNLIGDPAELPVSEASIAKAKEYIEKLGADSVEGKFATAFLNFDIDKRNIDAQNSHNMIAYQYNIDDAKNRGIITAQQAQDLRYGMAHSGSEERMAADKALEEIRKNASQEIKTTTTTTTVVNSKPSTKQQTVDVETKIDRNILKGITEESKTFQSMLQNDAAPLKVINSTSPQVMNGKVDVSYEAVSKIAGNIDTNYNYNAAIDEIRKSIEAEGADKARAFERFCDAENNEKVEEAVEAAKALTTDKQKEGARLVVESKMAGTITTTTSLVSEQMNTNTRTSGQTLSQTSSQTQNVLNQIAQEGRNAAETKK